MPCILEVEPVGLAGSCFCCGLAVLFHFSLKPPFIFLCKGEILGNLMELLWLKHNRFSVHSCFLSPHTRFQRRVLILSLCGHWGPRVGLTQHTETTLAFGSSWLSPHKPPSACWGRSHPGQLGKNLVQGLFLTPRGWRMLAVG